VARSLTWRVPLLARRHRSRPDCTRASEAC